MVRGYASVSIKDDLVAQVDRFIEENDLGYTNRAEVVTAALRGFLSGPEEQVRSLLERTLKAVALTEPKTVDDLLAALLKELDMRERQPSTPKASGARSRTESTSRQ